MPTSTSLGRQAEAVAAAFLKARGYTILAQNWHTRHCEIDIVAQKGDTVYCVEVKYRVSSRQGAGLEYITKTKLNQMRYAAETWVSEQAWGGGIGLMAIEVGGPDFEVTNFIESIY